MLVYVLVGENIRIITPEGINAYVCVESRNGHCCNCASAQDEVLCKIVECYKHFRPDGKLVHFEKVTEK
jgi:hypothetical protein